jgi:hypothetical protein
MCPAVGAAAYASDQVYEESLVGRVAATFGETARTGAGAGVIKCGTPLVYEIKMNWPNLSEPARQKIAGFMTGSRPVLDEYYDTPDGYFRLHYTRSGGDAVNMSFGVGAGNVPNYVLRCAALMDTVVQTEITALGYRFPVSDHEARAQEDPRFDIYMRNLGSNFYGLTYPDTLVSKPELGVYWLTSWMEISSDYTRLIGYRDRPFEAMAVTLAHEFFHSIQWTYDAEEAEYRDDAYHSWFHEVSSTWMEDVVFDRVDDFHSYLTHFFHHPWISLRVIGDKYDPQADQFHPYAACVWAMFLSERYDINVMHDVWERCGARRGFNTFDAFEWALAERGASFPAAWAEFLVWNYFTGSRWRSWSYQEGADFAHPSWAPPFDGQISDSLVAHHSEYPVEGSSSRLRPAYNSDELAGTYISFLPPPPGDTAMDFHFLLTPDSFDQWMVVTAGIGPSGKPVINYTADIFDPVTLADWTQYDEVLVVVSPFKSSPTQDVLDRDLSFRYSVLDTIESQKGISTTVYSNPLFLKAAGEAPKFRVDVSLERPLPVSMHIYTVDGILVRGAPDPGMSYAAGRRRVSLLWDGTNRNQKTVASGIYLALVQFGDKHEVIKVAVRNDR